MRLKRENRSPATALERASGLAWLGSTGAAMMQSVANKRVIYQWQNGRKLQSWRRRCSPTSETGTRSVRRAGEQAFGGERSLPRGGICMPGKTSAEWVCVCISRQGFQGPGGGTRGGGRHRPQTLDLGATVEGGTVTGRRWGVSGRRIELMWDGCRQCKMGEQGCGARRGGSNKD